MVPLSSVDFFPDYCFLYFPGDLTYGQNRLEKSPFQSQDQRGSTAGLGGLGGLEGAGNVSTSAVASNTTKLQTKV